MAAFNYSIVASITDGFHEGEYLGSIWTIRSYLAGASSFPLLVHGPMDFLPALLAGFVSKDQSIIVFTRTINTLIAGMTWIVFFDILLLSLRQNAYRYAGGAVSLLLFASMIAIVPADVVERQQTFLAVRDLFLVSALWCCLRGLITRSALGRYALMAIGGAAAAASLYWAYDRFLGSIAFSGALVLGLLVQRNWKPAVALVVGAGIGLVAIPYLAPTGSLIENAQNLLYWLKFSGEVWHLSYSARIPATPTAMAMIALLTVFALMLRSAYKRDRSDVTLAFFAGVFTLQVFFLLKYINLPRQPNNYYFVWPFVVLVAGLPISWAISRKIDDAIRGVQVAIMSGSGRQRLGLALLAVSLAIVVTNNMAVASLLNLRALVRPPADSDLLPPAVRAASRNLSVPGEGCVLLWSNEGVFATALRRPFCTRYMYPVYAAASREDELLRQIAAAPPAVVIFDSPFWSMNIYGRSMQQRLPAVDRYLRSHYQFTDRDGYKVGLYRAR